PIAAARTENEMLPRSHRVAGSQISLCKMKNMDHYVPTMSPAAQSRDRYLVKSILHSSQLLSAFHSPGEALPLKEISARCGLPKTMVFRLLYTLEKCGMVDKVGQNLYQSRVRPWKQSLYRLGYAAQGTDYQFSRDVSESLRRASAAEGMELISLDNRYSAKIAKPNAERLVGE